MSSPRSRPLPRTFGATFDERRNTSGVRPVPAHFLQMALDSLAALRRSDPALVRWIEDGAPTLTEAEHVERFGGPYLTTTRRRSRR